MIRLNCPTCGQKLGVDDARAGRMATCPKCRSKFRVPGDKAPKPPDAKLQLQHKLRRQADDEDKTWAEDSPPPKPAKPSRPPVPPPKKPDPEMEDIEIGDFEIIDSNPDFEIVEDDEEVKKPSQKDVPRDAIRARPPQKKQRFEDSEETAEIDEDELPRKKRRLYDDDDEEPRRKRKKRRKKQGSLATSAAMPVLMMIGSVVIMWLGLTALAMWLPLGTYALLGIGGVTALVGRLWFLFVVGQDDPLQRILVRFVPLYEWFYFFTHLDETLKPFMCSCVGTIFLVTGGLFYFLHPRHADHTDWGPSPRAHAQNPATADAECAKLLALQNKSEARQWLQGNNTRRLFKWDRQGSIQVVEELYKLGAKEVWVVNLENGGFLANVAGELVVVLPQEPEPRKKLLDWHNANPAEDEDDKLTDKGQKYMYLALD